MKEFNDAGALFCFVSKDLRNNVLNLHFNLKVWVSYFWLCCRSNESRQINLSLSGLNVIVTTINPVFKHWRSLNINILILGTVSPTVTKASTTEQDFPLLKIFYGHFGKLVKELEN